MTLVTTRCVSLLAALSVLCAAPVSAQYTKESAGGTGLPVGYIAPGINTFACSLSFAPMTGHSDCLYNHFGYASSSLSSATPFTFQGGMFRTTGGYSLPAAFLSFVGKDADGHSYASAECPLSVTEYMFCSFIHGGDDFRATSIVELTFNTSGGTTYFHDAPGGYYIGDELSFNATTVAPEPTEIALLGTGLILLAGVVRKRTI